MKMRFGFAALAAMVVVCLTSRLEAGCVIGPGGKSINVVTDNGASEQKSCSVKCQVDTKIGVMQVGCGGTTPPLAKAHSLCDFDKPDAYYRKVISSEDSCKGGAASAPAPTPAAAAPGVKPGTFICRISADGRSFDAMIANPYKVETSCQVNCQISTTQAGTTEQSSCTKNVAPGVGEVVLCSRTIDKGRFVKMVGGSGECVNPTPKPSSAEKDDDDDVDVAKLANDPVKMREHLRKQLPPEAQRMLDQMNRR
jgi:hypothetical protein